MESGLVIFLIWLAIAAIGVVASIKKKSKQAGRDLRQRSDEDIERYLREIHEKMINKDPAPEQPQTDFSREGERAVNVEPAQSPAAAATSSSQAKPADEPAAEPAKKSGLDFDPEEMVIYSEVMKPGYEKY